MRDFPKFLCDLISYAPQLSERDTLLERNIRDLVIETSNDGADITITSKKNNHALLIAVSRYLRNLGLYTENMISDDPEEQRFLTGNNVPRVEVEIDLSKGGSLPLCMGQGLQAVAPVIETLAKDRGRLKQYYTLVSKLNRLANVDQDSEYPRGAEIVRKKGKKAIIGLDFMDSWSEFHRSAQDGSGKDSSWQDRESDTPHVQAANEIFAKNGIEWPEGAKLISIKKFSGQMFYESFAAELARELKKKTKLKAHPSLDHDPDTPPSVLEIPVSEMMKNAATVNALLDKYLRIKQRLLGNVIPPSISSN